MSSHWLGRKCLITGGLGFIGSALARRLLTKGAAVTIIDNLDPRCGGNLANIAALSDHVSVHIADLRNSIQLVPLVSDTQTIFNLAGRSSHQDSIVDPTADLAANVTAHLALLESCREFNREVRIVFASTRQLYGRPRYLPVDEDHPVSPVDINGIHKFAGEHYHLLYGRLHQLNVSALRLTNTYGPRMNIQDVRQTFLGLWIRCLLEGKPFSVWGGAQLRDFNYIDDVVDALLLAASSPEAIGKVFNLGSPDVISLGELAALLVSLNGNGDYRIQSFPKDREGIDIGDYYADFGRFASLGWKPNVDLKAGLRRTLDFFHETEPAIALAK